MIVGKFNARHIIRIDTLVESLFSLTQFVRIKQSPVFIRINFPQNLCEQLPADRLLVVFPSPVQMLFVDRIEGRVTD